MEKEKKRRRIVRSQFDLQGYNDNEKGFPPSIVDSSQYEPLSVLVKKFVKGERKERFVPVYDVPGDADPEKAISELDPTRAEGFDLSDASEAKRRAREKLERHLEDKKQKELEKAKQPAPAPQGAGAPASAPGPQN